MNRDFTLNTYRRFLLSLLEAGYMFVTFGEVREWQVKFPHEPLPWQRYVMLRHDVDKKAGRSLLTAQIEHELGICASYYFRVTPQSNQPAVIRSIAELGHEIGYHYEDMSIANGDVEKALAHFEQWLTYFRTFYPVKTICMHGAPTSRYDGRDLWKTKDYRDYGIIGEPYFDIDFSQVFYLTDTGRCWDGFRVSVRDKVPAQAQWTQQGRVFHSTDDLIACLSDGTYEQKLGKTVMITTHPQRWTNGIAPWLQEYMSQNAKNLIKRVLLWGKGY